MLLKTVKSEISRIRISILILIDLQSGPRVNTGVPLSRNQNTFDVPK